MYSILLYMDEHRVRMTFRLEPKLARSLRALPNQTRFVEQALEDALGGVCPLCHGTGRVVKGALRVSDFRTAELPKLERDAAAQLKGLVRFCRTSLATDLELAQLPEAGELGFRIAREDQTLLSGR